MIKAESRGDYDFARENDALIVSDESGQRIALFLDERRGDRDVIRVAVDMPNSSGTRCYAIDFKWLINHLRKLEPEREASES
jgi:hypothetical protein